MKQFDNLVELGWTVVDAAHDGNCGFYCLLLGLENIGCTDYSIRQSSTFAVPMKRNIPWQFNVMRLRQNFQGQSRHLLRNEYPSGQRHAEWFSYSSATNDKEYDELCDHYCDKDMRQQSYFDGTLCEKGYQKYHMAPYWGAHVFPNTRYCVYQNF